MFQFPLQKILELRKWREKERAIHVANARIAASEAQQALEALEAAREAGMAHVGHARALGGAAGELQHLAYIVQQLEAHVAEANAANVEAEEKVADTVARYNEAFRERRTLDQLRQRMLEAWRTEQVHVDRKAMDEIAISRHKTKPVGGAEQEGSS